MKPQKPQTELNWLISAGIVGADIGTSVFYSTGILFPIVGYLAPLFVLISCLAMWIFKRTYEEGLAMSPYNGGAYSMILKTLGRRAAVGAGALTFVSYMATAAVSSLSGSYYLCSLFFDRAPLTTVVWISFIPIIFFGCLNIKGIKEPAKLVTGVAITHFILLFFIGIWGLIYMGFHWEEVDIGKFARFFSEEKQITLPLLAYGFAASFLGITGFESAAQIIESMTKPAIHTLRKLYQAVILAVSFTAPLISFCCLAILTQEEVNSNIHHLLSGVTEKMGGPWLKTILVIDAGLTLFAATNTALVGFIGLTITMAKHGNLPKILLARLMHKFPSMEGYPTIILPFIFIVMGLSAFVAGEVDIAAKVYEIAFLGVMVSFAGGTLLMRNKGVRRSTPKQYLSQKYLVIRKTILPFAPLLTGTILAFAMITLIMKSNSQSLLMLTFLLAVTSLLMAYYRWGMLENRLVTHSDLRLGFGRFANQVFSDLPQDLPKYVLCTGKSQTRHLILSTLQHIARTEQNNPFELILFYAEGEDVDDGEIFYELLQRVVSQQIASQITGNIILTVKILPGKLMEGLDTLKKTLNFKTAYFGSGHDPVHSYQLKETIAKELEISITSVY